jgi:threonyl-tRNA synthetase
VGLRRLRAFTMPDVHALCKDLNQAKKEFKRRFKLCRETLDGIGLGSKDYELGIRVTEDFFKKNKKFVQSMVKQHEKPALVEMWKDRFFYFILKYELNFVDAMGKASALSTDQIDVENGERYDIRYMDENGREKHPYVLHCSPSGAIERDIYALLEKAHLGIEKGKPPMLPLWLSPTQVRLIPVTEEHVGFAMEKSKQLKRSRIRVDVDDRSESVPKKIRDAEKEWIPYIIVLGDKEVGATQVPVRVREDGKLRRMSLKELSVQIKKQVKGKPYRPLPMPISVQRRPKFIG